MLKNKNTTKIKKKNNKKLLKMENSLLSQKEAAEYMDVTVGTLSIWTKKRLVPCYRMNRKVYYKKEDLMNSLVPQEAKKEDTNLKTKK